MSTSSRVHAGFASSMKWLAGRDEPIGEVAERDHRRAGDAGLQRAHIGLGVALPGELLLGETRAVTRLANAMADPSRKLTVLLGGAGTAPGPWHGGSLHPLASLT
jgi:hypothetical protein